VRLRTEMAKSAVYNYNWTTVYLEILRAQIWGSVASSEMKSVSFDVTEMFEGYQDCVDEQLNAQALKR
jgi:hypothetical protein